MRRLAALPLALLFVSACGDGTAPLDDAGIEDAGATDARTPRPTDSGVRPDPGRVPTLTGVSPRTGPETGGTRVTLRGTSFVEPAEVLFDGVPATSVVVLDEVSIAATTPPGAIGRVTVEVRTPGGAAELPEGFIYHRDLRLDAVEPARIPDEGGVEVAILGRGFDDDTLVLFDRQPLRGQRLVSAERITGFAPALLPGRPEVRLVNRDAHARRSDVVVVYGTPDLQAVAPGYGPIGGGAAQEIAGRGLGDASRIDVGSGRGRDLLVASDLHLAFGAPPLTEGAHDVTVANTDASGTLSGGYVAYDPSAAGLAVVGVVPARVSNAGGAVLTVVGRGFDADAQVSVGGRRALVEDLQRNAIRFVLPAGLAEGAQQVRVLSGADAAEGRVTLYLPIEVAAVQPSSGPASGGTEVTITGSGFVPGVEVRIADVPLADLIVVSATEVRGRTVAGSHGAQDVVVRSADTRGVLAGGFSFVEDFQLIRLEPDEGSIAGNTYVSIFGRGLEAPAAASFGGTAGVRPARENGSVIGVRTPPSGSGRVDVRVRSGANDETLFDAFSFYDPRLITGGAWGGPIEGTVNVGVMGNDGTPASGLVVQLGYDNDPRYRAVTDENGLATISSPEIRGPQTVTAGGVEREFVTFTDVNARNLTMFSAPHPQDMPPDAPRSPCPQGRQAPVVRGRIFKFKSSLDPVSRPGWVPVARITYTQANVFSQNPPEPPEQVDFVFEEGGEYQIVVMRAGTVAVYATLGDFHPDTQTFIPRRMGIHRSVPVAPESVTEGIHIALDIELDRTTEIRLDNPPEQIPGPSVNAVWPFLNLQSDGVIPFNPTALQGTNRVVLMGLPALTESSFFYLGGSHTLAGNVLSAPFSRVMLESADPFEEGVDLGPFLEMPQNASPKLGQLLRNGEVSWDQAGARPDITTINVVDVRSTFGCCCFDTNQNGRCDPGEGEQCGAGPPQQFSRWSVFGPGGLMSYSLPAMPSGLSAFETPGTYPWIVQQALAPRFNYAEFIYNQFSPFFWRSWSAWFSQFAVKEETD